MKTATKELPILMSGEMVRATLEGRKTQTRRIVKPQPPSENYGVGIGYGPTGAENPDLMCMYSPFERGSARWGVCKCPFGKPGQILWVRERWAVHGLLYDDLPSSKIRTEDGGCWNDGDSIWYAADGENPPPATGSCSASQRGKWRPSIHCPRWASRLTLEVTDVRVERLQEISHEDAIAEGCAGSEWVSGSPYIDGPHTDTGELPVEEFERLWESINGAGSWDANPFVWCVSFRKQEN